MKNLQLPQRKATRLKGYDYSSPGVYFITICTQNRKCMLSDLVVGEGLAPPETRLSEIGRIAEEQILALEERFPSVSIDRYVDYFHMQDLVTKNYSAVEFLCWFDGFNSTFPLPRTVEEYTEYLKRVIQFSKARNARIDAWCKQNSSQPATIV